MQEDDLKKAIDKVRSMRENKTFIPGDLRQLVQYFTNPSSSGARYNERFIINSNSKRIPLETKDIAVFFKDSLNYIYTFNGDKHIYDFSALEGIEKALDPNLFFRQNASPLFRLIP